MALGDLFKSKKDREREARREERKAKRSASRQLERSLDGLKGKIKDIRTKKDKDWAQAKDFMKAGQKGAASRLLKSCRASELLASKLERKAWFWEQRAISLEAGATDKEMALGLQELAQLMQIDPEQIDEAMVDVQEVLDEQTDVDRLVEKEYAKEMEGLAEQEAVDVASLEEMEKELYDEVAAEIGSESLTDGAMTEAEKSETKEEQIGTLRERLKQVLEEDE